jgi:hypothetical protein
LCVRPSGQHGSLVRAASGLRGSVVPGRRPCATHGRCGSARHAPGVARCAHGAWPAWLAASAAPSRPARGRRARDSLARALGAASRASYVAPAWRVLTPVRVVVSCSRHAVVERVSASRTRNSPTASSSSVTVNSRYTNVIYFVS